VIGNREEVLRPPTYCATQFDERDQSLAGHSTDDISTSYDDAGLEFGWRRPRERAANPSGLRWADHQ